MTVPMGDMRGPRFELLSTWLLRISLMWKQLLCSVSVGLLARSPNAALQLRYAT